MFSATLLQWHFRQVFWFLVSSSSSSTFLFESSKADFLVTYVSQKIHFLRRIRTRRFPLVSLDTESEASKNIFHIESSPLNVASHDIQNNVHDPPHIVYPVEVIHHCWRRRPKPGNISGGYHWDVLNRRRREPFQLNRSASIVDTLQWSATKIGNPKPAIIPRDQ